MKKQQIETKKTAEISIIGLYCNISRMIEICKVGGHSISFIYAKNLDPEHKVNPKDITMILDYYGIKADIKGDIMCEMVRPDWQSVKSAIFRKYESLEDINLRIEQAKKFKKPDLGSIQDVSYSLLGTAYERLNLSVSDVDIIRLLAQTIAQMAFSDIIRVEHIAEAIQYRSVDLTDYQVY